MPNARGARNAAGRFVDIEDEGGGELFRVPETLVGKARFLQGDDGAAENGARGNGR